MHQSRVHTVGRDSRDHLAPEVDRRRVGRLAEPQPVYGERTEGDREGRGREAHQEAAGHRHETGLCEIRVLGERDLKAPERDAPREQRDELRDLSRPAPIGEQHGDEQRGAGVHQRPAVQHDEPLGRHRRSSRTAAASARTRRSASDRPPPPSASTNALPTTTPSATRAVARACAAVPIPNPTAMGKRVAARIAATCLERSGGA